MKLILFYEKPGCSTNAKQKKFLKDAGHIVITRNLLQMEMSKEELFSYLKERALQEWFNPNAPKIKNGQIDPKDLSQEEALSLLLREPILIRRPLMSVHGYRMCGFDHKEIENVLGVPLQDRFQESCTLSNQCLTPVSPATP